jgi:hypothetical protein
MSEDLTAGYEALPKAGSYRLVNFEWTEVVTLRSFPPQFLLRVGGTKPYANMRVDLSPLEYFRQPEYWGIEVVGRLRGGILLASRGALRGLSSAEWHHWHQRCRGDRGDPLRADRGAVQRAGKLS